MTPYNILRLVNIDLRMGIFLALGSTQRVGFSVSGCRGHLGSEVAVITTFIQLSSLWIVAYTTVRLLPLYLNFITEHLFVK